MKKGNFTLRKWKVNLFRKKVNKSPPYQTEKNSNSLEAVLTNI